jgi:hypothetical protein
LATWCLQGLQVQQVQATLASLLLQASVVGMVLHCSRMQQQQMEAWVGRRQAAVMLWHLCPNRTAVRQAVTQQPAAVQLAAAVQRVELQGVTAVCSSSC